MRIRRGGRRSLRRVSSLYTETMGVRNMEVCWTQRYGAVLECSKVVIFNRTKVHPVYNTSAVVQRKESPRARTAPGKGVTGCLAGPEIQGVSVSVPIALID